MDFYWLLKCGVTASTADFGSASLGSNPGTSTKKVHRFWFLEIFIIPLHKSSLKIFESLGLSSGFGNSEDTGRGVLVELW